MSTTHDRHAPAAAAPPGVRVSPPPDDTSVARIVPRAWGLAAVLMVVGAVVYFAVAGVDLDAAVESATVPQVLPDVVEANASMSTTFILWLAAMVLFGVTAWSLPALPFRQVPLRIAAASLALAAGMAAVSFVVFLSVVHVAASTGAGDVAATLTWLASRLDWTATPLVIAVPPVLLVLVADDRRVFPTWLRGATALLVPASLATYLSLVLGTGLTTWGFLVVPLGVVVTFGVVITLWRRA